jgi:CRISPR/Cas system-associated protein Csm6
LLPGEPDSAFKSKKSSCVISLTLYGSLFVFWLHEWLKHIVIIPNIFVVSLFK